MGELAREDSYMKRFPDERYSPAPDSQEVEYSIGTYVTGTESTALSGDAVGDPGLRCSQHLPWRKNTLHWNEEYQNILHDPVPDTLEKYEAISRLASDFVYSAGTYGRIIISEFFLPHDEKTIKPCIIGGLAGGEKYIVQGILFKLAIDKHGIYESDEHSAKVAGHEIASLMALFSCNISDLCLPLAALIDYRGFRLTAISVLPITKKSIRYGSHDAGKNIAFCDEISKMMARAAATLNIAPHVVNGFLLHTPVDIEVHEGLDSRFYVVDAARLFPPEAPLSEETSDVVVRNAYLFRLLRPELVRVNGVALSSDAFSPFDETDPGRDKHRSDVADSTRRLHDQVIPAFARWLDQRQLTSVNPRLPLSNWMHRAGINMRHLLRIHSHAISKPVRTQLLTEAIARAVKTELRDQMRVLMRRKPHVPTEKPYLELVVSFLNVVLGCSASSNDFWGSKLPARLRRCFGASKNLLENDFLRDQADLPMLFARLQHMTNMQISQDALEQLEYNPQDMEFVEADIVTMHPRVKQMSVVHYAEGSRLMLKALSTGPSQASRLWARAEESIALAVERSSDSLGSILLWGKLLYEQARRMSGKASRDLLKRALRRMHTASSVLVDSGFDLKCGSDSNGPEVVARTGLVGLSEPSSSQDPTNIHTSPMHLTAEVVQLYILHANILATLAVRKTDYSRAKYYFEQAASRYEAALQADLSLFRSFLCSTLREQGSQLVAVFQTAMCHLGEVLSCEDTERELLSFTRQTARSVCSCDIYDSEYRVLDLHNVTGVRDEVVTFLLEVFPPLHELNLSGCPLVTDSVLDSLLLTSHSNSLKSLNLNGCISVSVSGIQRLAGACPSLLSLSVSSDPYAKIWIDASNRPRGLSLVGVSGKSDSQISKQRRLPKIYYVTQWREKFEEVSLLLKTFGWRVKLRRVIMPKWQQWTEELLPENLEKLIKLVVPTAFHALKHPCIMDISQIKIGGRRLSRAEHLQAFEDVHKFSKTYQNQRAVIYTMVGYTADGEKTFVYPGKLEGTIVYPPRPGSEGFGWDPIFVPTNLYKTMQEMYRTKFMLSVRHRPYIQLAYDHLCVSECASAEI